MSIIENILKSVVLDDAEIVEKVKLSASAYKIRLHGKAIRKNNFIPGSFLRMAVGIGNNNLSMKDKVRSYSVWNVNKTEGYLDLAIATHSDGIGSQWVKDCKVGDVVHFKMKKSNFLPDASADSYIMIGDLSALSHLYMIYRNIGENKQISSIIYSEKQEELFLDVDGSSPFNFYELSKIPSEAITAKLKKLLPNLEGEKIVYIAGDSRVCVALNNFFRKELNWNTKQIKTKPFWNPEKKGLE